MIAMITCQFTEILGGAEKQCGTLSKTLAARGLPVEVVTSRLLGRVHETDESLIAHRFPTYAPPQLAGRWLPASLIWAAQVLWWIYRNRRRITLLHVHQLRIGAYVAAAARRLFGIPVVAKLGVGGDRNDFNVIGSRKYVLGLAGTRFVIRNTDIFIAISAQIRADALQAGVPDPKIACIPNGVDLSTFRPTAEEQARRCVSIRAQRKFAYIGRFSVEKNVLASVRAFSRSTGSIPSTMCFAGSGPLESALRSKAQHDKRLRILGQLSDIRGLLLDSHFLVLASSSEGLSNAVLEALVAGVLPIVTLASGMTDAIPFDDYPLFAASDDEADIAEAIGTALAMTPEHWLSWSSRLREHAGDRFDIASVAEKYVKLYSSIGSVAAYE